MGGPIAARLPRSSQRRGSHDPWNLPEALTVRIKDACRMTGDGRSKLYLLIAAGTIDTIKVGSMTLIPIASLEAFLEGRRERR